MEQHQRAALKKFAEAVAELKDSGVIRSDTYLGDVAEFLCADAFGIQLAENLREGGHDGRRGDLKVQIKYGGGKKTNIGLGNPDAYDELYVVLGSGSVVRSRNFDGDFLVYRLTSDKVRKLKNPSGGFSCGASRFARDPDHIIHLHGLTE